MHSHLRRSQYTDAEQDDELSFKVGDIIVVTDQGTDDPEWWTGRIGSRMGLFPASYVKLIKKKGTKSSSSKSKISSSPKSTTSSSSKSTTSSSSKSKTSSSSKSSFSEGTRVVITFGKRKGVKAILFSKVEGKRSRWILKLTEGTNKGRKVEYPEKKFAVDDTTSSPVEKKKKKEKTTSSSSSPSPVVKETTTTTSQKKEKKSSPSPSEKTTKKKDTSPPPSFSSSEKEKTTRSSPPPPPTPKEDSLGYVKALYSFEGETEDEISFKKGEILRLLNNDSSDWWGGERLCANDKGEIESGFFPRTYVKKCAAPSSKRNDKTITKTTKERIDTKKMATSPNTVKSFVPSQFSLGQPFPIWVRGVRLFFTFLF